MPRVPFPVERFPPTQPPPGLGTRAFSAVVALGAIPVAAGTWLFVAAFADSPGTRGISKAPALVTTAIAVLGSAFVLVAPRLGIGRRPVVVTAVVLPIAAYLAAVWPFLAAYLWP